MSAEAIARVYLFPRELLQESAQCSTCGRLVLSGWRLGEVLDNEVRLCRQVKPATVIRALAVQFRRMMVDECAVCWLRHEAEKRKNAGFVLVPEMSTADADAVEKFYHSPAYRQVEEAERTRLNEAVAARALALKPAEVIP